MAWDHPNGLATAEIGVGSLNGPSPLLMSNLSKRQTPFVKVWALAPFVWEKTQNPKKKNHIIVSLRSASYKTLKKAQASLPLFVSSSFATTSAPLHPILSNPT